MSLNDDVISGMHWHVFTFYVIDMTTAIYCYSYCEAPGSNFFC
jgi:hypothetical protein